MAGIIKNVQEQLAAVGQSVTGGAVGNEYTFPAFDDLPKVKDMPQGSIWGFYDKDGKKDEVGGMPLRRRHHIVKSRANQQQLSIFSHPPSC
jgi:hypothetical protein